MTGQIPKLAGKCPVPTSTVHTYVHTCICIIMHWCMYILHACTFYMYVHMQMAVTQAYTQNVHSLFSGRSIADMSPDRFVLMVDRKNIVDSTVIQLIRTDEANLRKPLKVRARATARAWARLLTCRSSLLKKRARARARARARLAGINLPSPADPVC